MKALKIYNFFIYRTIYKQRNFYLKKYCFYVVFYLKRMYIIDVRNNKQKTKEYDNETEEGPGLYD